MNSKRLYFVLLGVIALLCVGLVAGAYGANKVLATQASKLTAVKAKSAAADLEQASLVKAKKDIEKYGDLERIAKTVVPQDKNQAEAVREIVNIAAANGVTLGAISFPSSTLGTTGAGAAPAGGKTNAPAQATPSGATATPSINSLKAANLSQLLPVKNIPGVYQLQISIDAQAVPYNQLINFLHDLEQDRRTAQVSTLNLQPTAANRNNVIFSFTLNEYIKP